MAFLNKLFGTDKKSRKEFPHESTQTAPDTEGMNDQKKGIEDQAKVLKHGDPQERKAAAVALGQTLHKSTGGPLLQGGQLLVAALSDEDKEVRWAAARAWMKANETQDMQFITALKHEEAFMREVAAEALGNTRASQAVESLVAVLKDKDPRVRKAAAEALGKIGGPQHRKSIDMLNAAAEQMGKASDPQTQELVAALKNEDEEERKSAVEMSISPLVAAINDEDTDVRRAAVNALGQIGDARTVESLTAVLDDEDEQVRELAAEALERASIPVAEKPVSAPEKAVIGMGLADPNHAARAWIDKASQIADQVITLQTAGAAALMRADAAGAKRLASAIDKALQESPDDLNLLVAKSGALYCAMQFGTAEEVIDQVLSINPEHFEARMRKEYWEKWPQLFAYPSWSDDATTLHPIMVTQRQEGRQVQIVRDGLQIGIATVQPARREDFPPQALSPRTRFKWEVVWSDTPYGAIVAQYMVIDIPGEYPWVAEGFLSASTPDEVTADSGYWLLRRLSNIGSCFLVLAEDDRAIFNKRFVFPTELRTTLLSISEKIAQRHTKALPGAFRDAQQWHMQNFDLERVHFE